MNFTRNALSPTAGNSRLGLFGGSYSSVAGGKFSSPGNNVHIYIRMKYTVIAAHNNGRKINFRLALCVCMCVRAAHIVVINIIFAVRARFCFAARVCERGKGRVFAERQSI